MTTNLKNYRVSDNWSGPLQPPDHCPPRADVVIIGGGIVGVSTAWFLARQGVSATLCEKGFIAGEQSGRNWGWVRVQGRDPREIPMMLESLRIWRTLAEDIGEDVGYTEGGCLYTARTQKEFANLAQWCDIANEHGLPTRMISDDDLVAQVGGSAYGGSAGFIRTLTDARSPIKPRQL